MESDYKIGRCAGRPLKNIGLCAEKELEGNAYKLEWGFSLCDGFGWFSLPLFACLFLL